MTNYGTACSLIYNTVLPELAPAQAARYGKSMAQFASESAHTLLPELVQARATQYDKTMAQCAQATQYDKTKTQYAS